VSGEASKQNHARLACLLWVLSRRCCACGLGFRARTRLMKSWCWDIHTPSTTQCVHHITQCAHCGGDDTFLLQHPPARTHTQQAASDIESSIASTKHARCSHLNGARLVAARLAAAWSLELHHVCQHVDDVDRRARERVACFLLSEGRRGRGRAQGRREEGGGRRKGRVGDGHTSGIAGDTMMRPSCTLASRLVWVRGAGRHSNLRERAR
jgi:hypothetical protein